MATPLATGFIFWETTGNKQKLNAKAIPILAIIGTFFPPKSGAAKRMALIRMKMTINS
jgi:hypothetical protein